jgi:RecG-like helicase
LKALLSRRPPESTETAPAPIDDVVPIATVTWRSRAKVQGRVRSLRIQPWAGVASLEATMVDDTGGITVVFLGRREIAGIHCGSRLVVEGMAGAHRGRLAMLNPEYQLEPAAG